NFVKPGITLSSIADMKGLSADEWLIFKKLTAQLNNESHIIHEHFESEPNESFDHEKIREVIKFIFQKTGHEDHYRTMEKKMICK
ncbi:MAG: hypothetical protein ACRC4L_03400, partial [Mycoplasma sp.]